MTLSRQGAGRRHRFENPPGSPPAGGSRLDWAAFSWRRFRDGRTQGEGLPPELVLPRAEVQGGLEALRRQDGILWLGHSCFLIRLGGRTLLTDPFLSDHASPSYRLGPRRHTPPALRAHELPPVDVVLLSHVHYDHLDRPALTALPGKEEATIVTGLSMRRYLDDLGYGRVIELGWHEAVALGDLQVTAVPAIHFNRRTLTDRNLALWCGFRAESQDRSIYFAGDTAYGPVFKEIAARYAGPDLALVPIGAYDPVPLMRAVHCTPEQAVALGQDLGATALCAMHWGAIRLTDEPILEPPARFRAAATAAGYAQDCALTLRVGETHTL
jgi:N-acyl-phosphatidylethanolamine-hydrolysing phospholipase D